MSNKLKSLSFIIPHKGREELLVQTLDAIAIFEYPMDLLTVHLMTQNSKLSFNPGRYAFNLEVHFCDESWSIAKLRNQGVEQAQTEFITFIDADITLEKNWVQVMFQEYFVLDQCVMLSPSQVSSQNPNVIEKIHCTLNGPEAAGEANFLATISIFMKKEMFLKAGGFSETLVTCEDYAFSMVMRQYGKQYMTDKTTFVHLGEDPNYGHFFKKEIWRSSFNLQSFKGRKIELREIPSLVIPLWGLFWTGGLILSVIFGSFSNFCLSFLGWWFPVFLLSIRSSLKHPGAISPKNWGIYYLVYHWARCIGTFKSLIYMIKNAG